MKTKKAAPTATKAKTVGYRFALIKLGDQIHNTTLAVIPDHHRTDTARWKRAEDRGVLVRTRTELAGSFRRWRANGFHPKKGHAPFTSLVAWLVTEGIHGRIELPARKEAANV